jgi:hypothetical protein
MPAGVALGGAGAEAAMRTVAAVPERRGKKGRIVNPKLGNA